MFLQIKYILFLIKKFHCSGTNSKSKVGLVNDTVFLLLGYGVHGVFNIDDLPPWLLVFKAWFRSAAAAAAAATALALGCSSSAPGSSSS